MVDGERVQAARQWEAWTKSRNQLLRRPDFFFFPRYRPTDPMSSTFLAVCAEIIINWISLVGALFLIEWSYDAATLRVSFLLRSPTDLGSQEDFMQGVHVLGCLRSHLHSASPRSSVLLSDWLKGNSAWQSASTLSGATGSRIGCVWLACEINSPRSESTRQLGVELEPSNRAGVYCTLAIHPCFLKPELAETGKRNAKSVDDIRNNGCRAATPMAVSQVDGQLSQLQMTRLGTAALHKRVYRFLSSTDRRNRVSRSEIHFASGPTIRSGANHFPSYRPPPRAALSGASVSGSMSTAVVRIDEFEFATRGLDLSTCRSLFPFAPPRYLSTRSSL